MPNPLAHAPSMLTVIRPNKMPRLWWLFPWSYAKTLHMSANAVKAYADRLDDILDIQRCLIEDQSAEIAGLRYRLAKLTDDVTRGTAITPDATPYRDETVHE